MFAFSSLKGKAGRANPPPPNTKFTELYTVMSIKINKGLLESYLNLNCGCVAIIAGEIVDDSAAIVAIMWLLRLPKLLHAVIP